MSVMFGGDFSPMANARSRRQSADNRALGPFIDTLKSLDLEALRQRQDEVGDPDEDVAPIAVAGNISVATWNAFAELDRLPHGLQLKQLLWANSKVFIVQLAIGRAHESAAGWIDRHVGNALGDDAAQIRSMNIRSQNQATYQADCSFAPIRTLPNMVVPQGIEYADWVPLVVKIMHWQVWDTVLPKIAVYSQLVGMEYILYIKMSRRLHHWTYECYDVPNGIPPIGRQADRHEFYVGQAQLNVHVEELDCDRLLGLSPQNPPRTVNDPILLFF